MRFLSPWFSAALIVLSGVNISWAQDLGTDQSFFDEEPLPALGDSTDAPENLDPEIDFDDVEQFSNSDENLFQEEDAAEFDQEPLPQIRRKRDIEELESYTKERKIKHPFAKKGLIRITKDKTYIYAVESSPQDKAASLRFGVFDPSNLTNPETGAQFSDLYDQTEAPIVLFDYEWQLTRKLGKVGIKIGTGIYAANGNGRFKDDGTGRNDHETPREVFTFIVLPNNIGAVYRMQFWDKQILIPYAEGGFDVFTFAELRDDNQAPKFGAAFGAHFSLGGAFNIGFLETRSLLELDREYGINNVYLTAEFRRVIGFNDAFDFSSNVINAGFIVEF